MVTLRQQQTLNQINQALVFKGEPLSAAQYAYMAALLRKNEPTERLLEFSEERMRDYVASRKQIHAQMLAAAATQLSPVQLEEFRLEFEIEANYLPYFAMRNRQAKTMVPPAVK